MTSIVNSTRSSCALDYVFKTGMIFWSDVMEEKIYTAPIGMKTMFMYKVQKSCVQYC